MYEVYYIAMAIKIKCLNCSHITKVKKILTGGDRKCSKCKKAIYYRQSINRDKCDICDKTYLSLVMHHKDGNHRNNKKKNIIVICNYCHSAIHRGINNSRYATRNYLSMPKASDRIKELREFLIAERNNKINFKEIDMCECLLMDINSIKFKEHMLEHHSTIYEKNINLRKSK